jgi:hypothetical protein
VIERGPNTIEGAARIQRATWLCECECGTRLFVVGHSLAKAGPKSGTRSCGCLMREKPIKHGLSNSRTYRIWHMMLQRCRNPKNSAYKSYGGRGITVCDEWSDFRGFVADMGEAPEGLTLDRVDNSNGYGPTNCRWATKHEQQNNMRSNVRLSFGGRTMTLAEWGRETGLGKFAITNRLKAGWSIERALTTRKQH